MKKYCSACKVDVDKYEHKCPNRSTSAKRKRALDKVYSTREWTNLSKYLRSEHPMCERCCSIDNLEVHHIDKVEESIERGLDISNCVVLCRSCHTYVEDRGLDFKFKGYEYKVTVV